MLDLHLKYEKYSKFRSLYHTYYRNWDDSIKVNHCTCTCTVEYTTVTSHWDYKLNHRCFAAYNEFIWHTQKLYPSYKVNSTSWYSVASVWLSLDTVQAVNYHGDWHCFKISNRQSDLLWNIIVLVFINCFDLLMHCVHLIVIEYPAKFSVQ